MVARQWTGAKMASSGGTSGVDTAGGNQTSVYNALVPKEGAKAVATMVDLTVAYGVTIDFTLAYLQGKISQIQCVYIDNSANAYSVTLTTDNPVNAVTCPAYSQGTFPIISAIRAKILATSLGAVIIPMVFLNVPVSLSVWSVESPLTTRSAKGGSATRITNGGTAVVVFASGSIATGAFITNPDSATESLFVDFCNVPGTTTPGANGTTCELVAGSSLAIPAKLTTSVQANAITNGHTFVAVQY